MCLQTVTREVNSLVTVCKQMLLCVLTRWKFLQESSFLPEAGNPALKVKQCHTERRKNLLVKFMFVYFSFTSTVIYSCIHPKMWAVCITRKFGYSYYLLLKFINKLLPVLILYFSGFLCKNVWYNKSGRYVGEDSSAHVSKNMTKR